jgi:hypothetical protein
VIGSQRTMDHSNDSRRRQQTPGQAIQALSPRKLHEKQDHLIISARLDSLLKRYLGPASRRRP